MVSVASYGRQARYLPEGCTGTVDLPILSAEITGLASLREGGVAWWRFGAAGWIKVRAGTCTTATGIKGIDMDMISYASG